MIISDPLSRSNQSWFAVILLCFSVVLVLLLPFSCENTSNQANVTRGESWLWSCRHKLSKPFQPEESYIYWHGQNDSPPVLFMYNKGEPDLKHQTKSFENRTKIFPDELHYGNFSLVVEKMKLEDDQTSLEIIFLSADDTLRICQTTVYVAGMIFCTYNSLFYIK